MFFRRARGKKATSKAELAARAHDWQAFAERLELADASFRETYVRELIFSEDATEFSCIYGLEPTSDLTLLLFDYVKVRKGPLGEARKLVSNCLLSATHDIAPLSLRASPRQDVRLETLGASASGGEILRLDDDPAFSDKVTLYAREADRVQAFLTAPLKRVMLQIITRAKNPALRPTLLLGEQHILLSCSASADAPTSFEVIEGLTTDALSLYSALLACQRT
ncbi:MAG: hypothetical protein AAF267_25270 [Deinococcota bacterium]